jgi:small subunit ribosomal protein S18
MAEETQTTQQPDYASEAAAEKASIDSAEGRAGEGRVRPRRKRKVSYLTINKIDYVDYKEVNILKRFLSERGKILPSRQSGNTAKQQRMIARAIKRAREMALLPFVARDISDDGSSRRGRFQSNLPPTPADQANEAASSE